MSEKLTVEDINLIQAAMDCLSMEYMESASEPPEYDAVCEKLAAMRKAAQGTPQRAEQQPQPESATHYRPSTGVYYEVIDGKTYAWRDPKAGWMPSPRKGIPDDCVCLSSEQQPVAGLVEALTTARETIASALRASAPDYFATDADIARHVVIQRIDTALAAYRKQGGGE